MPNPLLSRLDNEVVAVDPSRQEWFESCLRAICEHPHAADLTVPDQDHLATSEDDGFWPPADNWRAQYRPYLVRQGVLLVPVMGVLLNRFSYQLGHWATGYTYIERAVRRGMDDPEVKGIAFICDSPGGESSGVFELCDKIAAYRGTKPMRAFASDRAYSACYMIACSANSISMTRTAGVGSIGVVSMHVDYSDMLSMAGIRVTFFKFGAMKTAGNPYERLSKQAKIRIQARIDRLGEMFVAFVAKNRGLEEQAVRDTEADCFQPEEAVELGLADRIEVHEDALISFTELCTSGSGEDDMTQNATTSSAGTGAKVLTQADLDAAVAQAKADAKAEAAAEAAAAANTAAKTRMTAILGCDEAKTRQKAALSIVQNTDLTVEQAKAFLAGLDEETKPTTTTEAPKGGATGALFQAAMNGGKHPEVGSGEPGAGAAETDDDKMAAAILADHTAATGFEPRSKKAA